MRVSLDAEAQTGLPPHQLQIVAQVSGPLDSLRYRWFSGTGEVQPQESDRPSTLFTFADGASRDRISVDVWRGAKRVGHDEIEVKADARWGQVARGDPGVRVTVTETPPYDPAGGPDTRSDIGGMVEGAGPDDRILIFARADVWYIQPGADAVHVIGPDGRWRSWTHTGSSYAVLVVDRSFVPLPRYDMLPPVGGAVRARVTVEGARK